MIADICKRECFMASRQGALDYSAPEGLEGLREQLAGIERQIARLAEQVTQFQKDLAASRIPVEQQKALLSKKEAAQMLCLSVRTVQRLIIRGELRARRMGSRVLIPRKEIDRLASRDVVRIRPRRIGACEESELPAG